MTPLQMHMRLVAVTALAVSCHSSSAVQSTTQEDLTTRASIASAKQMLRVRQPDRLIEVVLDACGGCAWSIQPLLWPKSDGPLVSADVDIRDATSSGGVVLTRSWNGRTDAGVLYILPRGGRGDDGLPTRADVTLICDGDSENRRIWVARFDGVWKLDPMEVPGT